MNDYLTIRLSDEKHERLRQLAEQRRISMNKLIEELSSVALTEFDAPRHASEYGQLLDLARKA